MISSITQVIILACLATVLAVSIDKRDGEHAHERDHVHEHEHHSDYQVPSYSYEPPVASYSSEVSASYGEPSHEPSYDAESPYNPLTLIQPIILGIFALIGFSLLFPNNVRIDSVRRRRSALEGKRVESSAKVHK